LRGAFTQPFRCLQTDAAHWSCPGLTDTDGLAGYAADGTRLIDVSTVCRRSYSAGLR
jgi:hypothetical protein